MIFVPLETCSFGSNTLKIGGGVFNCLSEAKNLNF